MKVKWLQLFVILCCAYSCIASANASTRPHTFYFGAVTGYGATTWSGLVPLKVNMGDAMTMSTPVNVREGGPIWGMYFGYELFRHFALETSYRRWPNAKVTFDPDSLFAFEHDGQTSFISHTETASLLAKLMIDIPKTSWRAFSSFGVSGEHRYDEVQDMWRLTPTFAVGVNYFFKDRWMVELGGDYTAGYAESELDPSKDYIPFLFSGFIRIAYFV